VISEIDKNIFCRSVSVPPAFLPLTPGKIVQSVGGAAVAERLRRLPVAEPVKASGFIKVGICDLE